MPVRGAPPAPPQQLVQRLSHRLPGDAAARRELPLGGHRIPLGQVREQVLDVGPARGSAWAGSRRSSRGSHAPRHLEDLVDGHGRRTGHLGAVVVTSQPDGVRPHG